MRIYAHHTHIKIYSYTNTHLYVYTHMCTYTDIYIHTYIQTYTSTHTDTSRFHTHTFTYQYTKHTSNNKSNQHEFSCPHLHVLNGPKRCKMLCTLKHFLQHLCHFSKGLYFVLSNVFPSLLFLLSSFLFPPSLSPLSSPLPSYTLSRAPCYLVRIIAMFK